MAEHKVHGSSAIKNDRRYTVRDYMAWPAGERWELIHGIPYSMNPAPRVAHQRIVGNIFAGLERHLEEAVCETLVAPVDVFLSVGGKSQEGEIGDSATVVQPDVIVVCDPDKFTEEGVRGAPDFVVEVLSDTTAYRDLNEKKTLYERHGVREYWIINPGDGSVLVWVWEAGRFAPVREYRRGEPIPSAVLDGFVWSFPESVAAETGDSRTGP